MAKLGEGAWRAARVLVFLAGACLPPPTRNAIIRRQAEDRLASCLGLGARYGRPGPMQRQACKQESIEFCQRHGLEGTCGMSGLFTRRY